MRALIFELHPTLLDTHGLVAAIREQAAWITTRGGPAVTVDGPDERLDIAADAELDAYRLTQEALHNCVKHAGATHVQVRIGSPADNPATLVLRGRGRRRRLRPGDDGTRAGAGLDARARRTARRRSSSSPAARRRHRRPARRSRRPGRCRVTAIPTPEAEVDPIRVFVVDDHEVVRLGLRAFLGATPDDRAGRRRPGRAHRAGAARRARRPGRPAGRRC